MVVQLLQGRVQLLAKGDTVKLILHGAMEAFTDAVGLRRLGSSSAVIDVLHRQIQLIFVMLALAAVLGSAIGQDAQQRNVLLFKERYDTIIQHVSRVQCIYAIVEFGKSNFRVGVDEGV